MVGQRFTPPDPGAKYEDQSKKTRLREVIEDSMADLPAGEDGSGEGAAPNDENDERDWLQIARVAYMDSTDYFEANHRAQQERNLHLFQSRHPPGSKYLTDDWKNRSRLFRPKTRAGVRRSEAAAAAAFFTTQDVVSVSASDDNNAKQQASAEIGKELLQHRLTKTIPWFLTLVGAWQATRVSGIVASRQSWVYEQRVKGKRLQPVIDEMTGQPMIDEFSVPIMEEVEEIEVLKDEPEIRLFPVENIRFDPAADWIDPINSSPYLVVLHPVYVVDAKARMKKIDPKTGQPEWFELDDAELVKGRTGQADSVRMARQGGSQDSTADNRPLRDFDVIWVHENFIRLDGDDVVYYTVGTEALLSKPRPVKDVYHFDRVRPYVLGRSQIEAFRTVPASSVELTQDLQVMANEVANQRIDNVKLAMNARYFARRGTDVDYESLKRNVSGSVTLMKDPEKDVVVHRAPDVTSSAYVEQDRINVDFDELSGIFSAGSVQSNRQLNETVGGMKLLAGDAAGLGEYDLRTFTETWVEPVLRQILQLEQRFETNVTLLTLAGQKAQIAERFGINEITDEVLEQELTLTVSVGIGATNPIDKMQKFMLGADAMSKLFGEQFAMMADPIEISKEIFGNMGYRDGARFFKKDDNGETVDPKLAMAQKVIEKLTQELEAAKQGEAAQMKKIETEARLKDAAASADHARDMRELDVEAAIKRETMAREFELKRRQQDHEFQLDRRRLALEGIRARAAHQLKEGESRQRRGLDLDNHIHQRQLSAAQNAEKIKAMRAQRRQRKKPAKQAESDGAAG